LEKVSNAIFPESTFQGRFDRLTRLISWIFPFISFLVVIPLYYLSRHFLGEQQAVLPSLLYLFAPNILLIPLFLDQVLYPLLFLVCIFCVFTAIQAILSSFIWRRPTLSAVFAAFSMIGHFHGVPDGRIASAFDEKNCRFEEQYPGGEASLAENDPPFPWYAFGPGCLVHPFPGGFPLRSIRPLCQRDGRPSEY
jgi:hypothetical protein